MLNYGCVLSVNKYCESIMLKMQCSLFNLYNELNKKIIRIEIIYTGILQRSVIFISSIHEKYKYFTHPGVDASKMNNFRYHTTKVMFVCLYWITNPRLVSRGCGLDLRQPGPRGPPPGVPCPRCRSNATNQHYPPPHTVLLNFS